MAQDWRKGKTPPKRIPHPYSAEGRSFDWASVGAPHPDSVEGRNFNWSSLGVSHPASQSGRKNDWRADLSQREHEKGEELAKAIEEVERFLEYQSNELRDALEDSALQSTYDQQLGPREVNAKFLRPAGRVGADLTVLARRLQIALGWFNPELVRLSHLNQDLGDALDKAYLLREDRPLRKKKDLLKEIQGCVEKVFAEVTKDVKEQLTEAKRTGERNALIQRWRAQMVAFPAYKPTAWGARDALAPPMVGPVKKMGESPATTRVAVKTWVEFRLVDQDGKPVPNAAYKVTLPDNSVQRGSLDDKGSVRFDEIDPGQCQITFPEIDGKEWKAA